MLLTLTAFLQALLLGQELIIYTIIFILVGKFLPVLFSVCFLNVCLFLGCFKPQKRSDYLMLAAALIHF